ncbi:unnamed protein product, partial [Symbiodinium sp. CCMP2456]
MVLQGDANASIGWVENSGQWEAIGRDAKAFILLDRLAKHGISLVPPLAPYRALPTSRPRQEGRQGRQIDMMGARRLRHEGVTIFRDSYLTLGTDHELLCGSFRVVAGKEVSRFQTKPRVWTGGLERVEFVDQAVLEDLALRCTRPKVSLAYKDPEAVKLLFRKAKLLKSGEAWKCALAARKAARRHWEGQRETRALQGDWQAFRQCKPQARQGWEIDFADRQSRDPHAAIHDHLSSIYKGQGQDIQPIYDPCQEVVAFTVDELQQALGQLKGSKSVGRDLTSKELLTGLVNTEGGQQHLLEFMNRTLATQIIPAEWNKPLLIVLPKLDQPASPGDLRPIALGSTGAKLFSRMILNRVKEHMPYVSHAQCAGSQRQPSDVIFSVWRLLQLEREWKAGLVMAQIDISKAFDTLSRQKLLSKLLEALGNTAEYRCEADSITHDEFGALLRDWSSGDIGDHEVVSRFGQQVLDLLRASVDLEQAGVWTQDRAVEVSECAAGPPHEGTNDVNAIGGKRLQSWSEVIGLNQGVFPAGEDDVPQEATVIWWVGLVVAGVVCCLLGAFLLRWLLKTSAEEAYRAAEPRQENAASKDKTENVSFGGLVPVHPQ